MKTLAPLMFVSHGSPMFALEQHGPASDRLAQQRDAFKDVRAVIVMSPHWMTRGGVKITSSMQPETIHDFGGFPRELYSLQYPAKGDPVLAQEVKSLIESAGYHASLDSRRGLDHGVWVPLMHLIPDANIPVIQVSLDMMASSESLLALGRVLSPLREMGIAIIGSGSLTHNLYEIRGEHDQVAAYAEHFESWVRDKVMSHNEAALANAMSEMPVFRLAHPTPDHYLPILFSMGAVRQGDELSILDAGIYHYSLSMESYVWQ